jgi:sugar phosphate isomerase/epimerase
MKFALRISEPDGSVPSLATAARDSGFDGLDLPFLENSSFEVASLDLPIASLSLPEPIDLTEQCGQRVRTLIDRAGALDCRLVQVQEAPIAAGKNRSAHALSLGDWLSPLADYAGEHEVILILNTALSCRTARETWAILDRLNHPSLCCCLDAQASARVGDSPQVSVPMLNSRIGYARVSDAKDLSDPSSECDLGQGVVPIETMISRLRGIGYAGWVAVKAWGPQERAGENAARAIQTLRLWSKPPERTKAKPRTAKAI